MPGVHWRNRCVELLRCVDPHNLEPLYVLSDREVAGQVDMSNAKGIYNPALRYGLRETIDQCIGWNGPGFVCAIRLEDCPYFDDLADVLLHEYAHHIEMHERTNAIRETVDADRTHALWEMEPRDYPVAVATSPPWEKHGPSYIRVCIHLAHRARRNGWRGTVDHLVQSDRYLLSPATLYAHHSGDEPERLQDRPLLKVSRTDPPGPFKEFAEYDLNTAREMYAADSRSQMPGNRPGKSQPVPM